MHALNKNSVDSHVILIKLFHQSASTESHLVVLKNSWLWIKDNMKGSVNIDSTQYIPLSNSHAYPDGPPDFLSPKK